MCHSKLEVTLGLHINFIIGSNGSEFFLYHNGMYNPDRRSMFYCDVLYSNLGFFLLENWKRKTLPMETRNLLFEKLKLVSCF